MNPFSQNPDETIARLGEKQLLRRIREWLGDTAPPTPEGMGDDCAEIPEPEKSARLVTTDSVVLGFHFEADTPPEAVGAKLLKRNLSDIAAMGGIPSRALVSGFLPGTTRLDWLEACLRGLAASARHYAVRIVGGDLTGSASDLALNLTLLGGGERFLYRHGGQPGDWICVTGQLGGSRLGRHLSFEPRLREGRALAAEKAVRACIDISDGLAIDLLNLLPDSASASIDPEVIPIHPDAGDAAVHSGKNTLFHALNDGEDHELLFLIRPDNAAWESLKATFREAGLAPLSRIGSLVQRGRAPILDKRTGQPLADLHGYDHFR